MTPSQRKRFDKLAKDVAELLTELRKGDHPDATLFLEDGLVAIYDWPADVEQRPDEALTDFHFWDGASGGGR